MDRGNACRLPPTDLGFTAAMMRGAPSSSMRLVVPGIVKFDFPDRRASNGARASKTSGEQQEQFNASGTTSSYQNISILEAVIKQTGVYAKSRGGRLSVYWGDQIFIPSADASYTPTHEVDIMCTLREMPDAATNHVRRAGPLWRDTR